MTVTAHDYKYTDRDVREDSRLEQLAVAYVQEYGGDFEPVLNAKRIVARGGELPTAVVRTVLNCMRHDYNVADKMPIPNRPIFIVPEPDAPRWKSVKVPKPERVVRYPFDLKTIWKRGFIAATHPQAKAYHLLDPAKSRIRYYPAVGKFDAQPRPFCSAELRTGVLLSKPPQDRYLCRTCDTLSQESDRRETERLESLARLQSER